MRYTLDSMVQSAFSAVVEKWQEQKEDTLRRLLNDYRLASRPAFGKLFTSYENLLVWVVQHRDEAGVVAIIRQVDEAFSDAEFVKWARGRFE